MFADDIALSGLICSFENGDSVFSVVIKVSLGDKPFSVDIPLSRLR